MLQIVRGYWYIIKNCMFPKKYIKLKPTAKGVILRNISFLERELFISKEMISEFY